MVDGWLPIMISILQFRWALTGHCLHISAVSETKISNANVWYDFRSFFLFCFSDKQDWPRKAPTKLFVYIFYKLIEITSEY